MKLGLVVFVLLVITVSAFEYTVNKKNTRIITGEIHHRNITELKEYHQRQRLQAASDHRFYIPSYPAEPVVSFVKIGEAEELFRVSLESGTNSFWVLDVSYPEAINVTTFDPHSSDSTATEVGPFKTQSQELEYYGTEYKDVVTYFNSMEQNFGSVNRSSTWSGEPLYDKNISGVLGLAWNPDLISEPLTSASAPILNILSTLPEGAPRMFAQAVGQDTESGKLSWSIFGFGGELDGVCEPTSIVSAPLSFDQERYSFGFQFDTFTLGDYYVPGGFAKIDSGSPIITVTWAAYDLIYKTLDANFDYDAGIYTTDCTNRGAADDFIFTVGDVKLNVPSTSYVVDVGLSDNECALAMEMSWYETAPWVLGIPFQYNYCVKFDVENSEISFQTYVPDTTQSPSFEV
ncbi:Aspartic protease 17 [Aphelenchoides besseyi]|nr:Aspartic protease 17 [Aphelenchoides besseyi]